MEHTWARGAPRLGERLDGSRDNNFDIIRLVAASLVVFSHSFLLSYGNCERDPLFWLSDGAITSGSTGVAIFFVTSGFLITKSYDSTPNPFAFVVRRGLRILPALVLVVALTAFVLGPLATTLPASEYLAHPQTWSYLVNAMRVHVGLPGVFEQNPLRHVVNGSLWTLPHEMILYAGVFALGVARVLRARSVLGLIALALVAYTLVWKVPALQQFDPFVFWRNLFGLQAYFWAGSALYLLRHRVVLSGPLALGAAVLLALASLAGDLQPIFVLCGGYLVIYAAFAFPLPGRGISRYGDFSYGMYVFGYPIQQFLAQAAGGRGSWWSNLFIAYPLILACAILSWHGVEKRALALKTRLEALLVRPTPTRA